MGSGNRTSTNSSNIESVHSSSGCEKFAWLTELPHMVGRTAIHIKRDKITQVVI